MRRKKKKLLKKIITLVIIGGILFTLVKTGTLNNLIGSIGSFEDFKNAAKETVDSITKQADSGVKNLEKIVEKYVEENGDDSSSSASSTSKKDADKSSVAVTQDVVNGLEIPAYIKNHQVVQHDTYTLSYNEDYEQPDWVAYTLTTEDLNNRNTSRSEDFREDEAIETDSAHLSDYRGSGYDRGHLLSSANRVSSEEVNSETFLLSNMSPMIHRFNAGLFLKAEDAERDAARQYGTLYIVTGPVFSDGMETIGECDVAVPEEFYKVFLGQDSDGEWHAIGLILPQEYEDGNLKPYFATVDEVEKATGLDFYPSLDNATEKAVESEYDLSYWPKSFR